MCYTSVIFIVSMARIVRAVMEFKTMVLTHETLLDKIMVR